VTNTYVAQIVLGALFLVVIIFLPRGILPTASEKLTAIRASRQRRATEQATGPPPGLPIGATAAGNPAEPTTRSAS
jgi:hypothetical protein